jgi:hypothetical protein
MIVRCHVCHADPCGRWKPPPAMIFVDSYAEGGPAYACRSHLSPKKEEEVAARERAKGGRLQ